MFKYVILMIQLIIIVLYKIFCTFMILIISLDTHFLHHYYRPLMYAALGFGNWLLYAFMHGGIESRGESLKHGGGASINFSSIVHAWSMQEFHWSARKVLPRLIHERRPFYTDYGEYPCVGKQSPVTCTLIQCNNFLLTDNVMGGANCLIKFQ